MHHNTPVTYHNTPMNVKSRARGGARGTADYPELRRALEARRGDDPGLTLRAVAAEIGVTHPSLLRFLQGGHLRRATAHRLERWLARAGERVAWSRLREALEDALRTLEAKDRRATVDRILAELADLVSSVEVRKRSAELQGQPAPRKRY